MFFGSHVSAAGGVFNAPKNSAQIGGEIFQFFSRSPQGGPAPVLTSDVIKTFQRNMKKYGQKECYIHAPYFINLASGKNNVYYSSITVLREELERGTILRAKYMMTHLGSAKELGEKEALKKVSAGLNQILDKYQGYCQPLIEISAGSGAIIGDNFEEIAIIIQKVNYPLGICFDTAHAFESGYDLRDEKLVKKTLTQFDKLIGLKKLKLIHANDSKTELGSRRDRHENIGRGKIGMAGFCALVQYPAFKKINFITETPDEELDRENLEILKKIRSNMK
jgi:deoxyribonuclease-4